VSGAGALRAFSELRMLLLWRRLRGRGGVAELVAKVLLFAIALPAGLAFAIASGFTAFHAVRAGQGLRATLPATALFFGVWQTWTAVALSMSEREALDLRRFLGYPIPPGRLFGYGLAASVVGDPFALFWGLLLAGAFAGAALARPGPWVLLLAVAHLGFVASTVALVALLQALLARLVRGRRARALGIAAVYLGTGALVLWSAAAGRSLFEVLRVLGAVRWIAYPAALADQAVRALYVGSVAAALPWLGALLVAVPVTGWLAYRLELAAALAGGGAGPARAAATGKDGWRLPGRLGALLEKEGKYLLRHPLPAVLAVILPAVAAVLMWRLGPKLAEEGGAVIGALPLFGFALYAHLALQVFWLNAFGWERSGGRLWYLAPVPPADLLVAKNLATYAFSLVLFLASAAAAVAFGGMPPPWVLGGALLVHAGTAPWLLTAGNFVSILNPSPAPMTVQRGSKVSALSGLAGMAAVSGAGALFAIPALLAVRLDAPWVLVAGAALLGVTGGAVYAALLPRAARLFAARREALLEAVCGDET
jgi:ABC-2 type transport system permease protein